MFDDIYSIIGGILFGLVGMAAFSFGRRMDYWKPKSIGLLMMTYPLFVYNRWAVWGAGTALTVLLWFHHDE